MVLRLYRQGSCVNVYMSVNRLVFSLAGKLEVRLIENDVYIWKKFRPLTDFDSFVLATE